MEVGAVKLSDMIGTGRMDAPFHLARAKHRVEVERLIKFGRVKLNEALAIVPGNSCAVRAVARGMDGSRKADWKPGPGYSDLEVAVYIACAIGTADAALKADRDRLLSEAVNAQARRKRLREILA